MSLHLTPGTPLLVNHSHTVYHVVLKIKGYSLRWKMSNFICTHWKNKIRFYSKMLVVLKEERICLPLFPQFPQPLNLIQKRQGNSNIWVPYEIIVQGVYIWCYIWNMNAILDQGYFFLIREGSCYLSKMTRFFFFFRNVLSYSGWHMLWVKVIKIESWNNYLKRTLYCTSIWFVESVVPVDEDRVESTWFIACIYSSISIEILSQVFEMRSLLRIIFVADCRSIHLVFKIIPHMEV